MKLTARNKVSRRGLMQALGGSALLLPGLELFGEVKAQAPARKAKYAIFCYTNDGVNQRDFWPTGGTRDFQLNKIMDSFQGLEDQMLILGAQNNRGLEYPTKPPQHQAPVTTAARAGRGCMPGQGGCYNQPVGLLYAKNQFTANNDIDGPSIDQVIANAVAGDSIFKSLEFGMHPIGGDTPSDINFDLEGRAIKRMVSAEEVFNRVFGMPVEPVGRDLALKKASALTDFLHGSFTSLRPNLSSHDRRLLDAHLTSLSSLEMRRLQQLENGASAAQCSAPSRDNVPTDRESQTSGADTEMLSPYFMDTITTALSCGLTKVASVTFGYPGGGGSGGLRFPWLNIRNNNPLHNLSHHGNNAANLAEYTTAHQWIGGQISRLMRNLGEVTDPDGVPIIDNTVIYWFNRHGDGNSHSNNSLPNVILGGTGGYFDMGRFLKLPSTNPTEVLISIANSMGVDVPTFGEERFRSTQPLGGLVA